MPVMIRATSRRPEGQPYGAPEWLQVVHEANRVRPGTFKAPTSTGKWWAGGWVEEYPDARVILDTDEFGDVTPESGARIVGKTKAGDDALIFAAENLGIEWQEAITVE